MENRFHTKTILPIEDLLTQVAKAITRLHTKERFIKSVLFYSNLLQSLDEYKEKLNKNDVKPISYGKFTPEEIEKFNQDKEELNKNISVLERILKNRKQNISEVVFPAMEITCIEITNIVSQNKYNKEHKSGYSKSKHLLPVIGSKSAKTDDIDIMLTQHNSRPSFSLTAVAEEVQVSPLIVTLATMPPVMVSKEVQLVQGSDDKSGAKKPTSFSELKGYANKQGVFIRPIPSKDSIHAVSIHAPLPQLKIKTGKS